MAYSKTKKILLILLCLFVILFPFWCVRGLCAEPETVDFDIVDNLSISENRNYFDTSTSSVGYVELDKNYIYTIISPYGRALAFSNSVPALNVPYQFITFLNANTEYSFVPTSEYLYFNFSNSSNVTVTRRPINRYG